MPPNPTLADARERFFSLDILRGLAALAVLWRHIPAKPAPHFGWSERVVDVFHAIGWCGVDLFFVLSGFLISNLLFREYARTGGLDLKRFWIRRTFKIWPSYFAAYGLMVAAGVGYALITGDAESRGYWLRTIVPNALFFQNYCHYGIRWDNSWSIAVEEHFYLALPLLLTACASWARRRGSDVRAWFAWLPWVGLAIGPGVLLLRAWRVWRGGGWMDVYYPTHLRFDALYCGVVIGCLWNFRPRAVERLAAGWRWWLTLAVGALAAVYFLPLDESPLMRTAGFTLLYVAFGGLVVCAIRWPDFGRTGRLAVAGHILQRAGIYSYTIYLAHSVVYHLPGIEMLRDAVGAPLGGQESLTGIWADRLLFWTLSLAGGVALAHAVERPFLALRQKWFPSADHLAKQPAEQLTELVPLRKAA